MTKFEYLVKAFGPGREQAPDQLQIALNDLGDSGWEVVATFVKDVAFMFFVLKRPKG
jgi:hypothetical protein